MNAIATETVPEIGADCAGVPMTPEEFDAITEYDDLYRYELIRGILVVSPIPSQREAEPNELLGNLLYVYRQQHPRGSSLDLTLPERFVYLPESRRRADRLIWAGLGRRPGLKEDVPTIAVEFVSKGKASWRRDYEEKRREYLALGVAEYWIVDRFCRTLTVYRNAPGPAAEEVIVAEGVYRPALLPGFELPVADLLTAADAGSMSD